MWSSEFRPSNPHEVWISLRATYCAVEIVPVKGWNVTPYNYLTIKKWHQIIIRKWPFVRSWKAASPFISQISILLCPQHLMTHMNLEGVVGIGVRAPWESLPQAGWSLRPPNSLTPPSRCPVSPSGLKSSSSVHVLLMGSMQSAVSSTLQVLLFWLLSMLLYVHSIFLPNSTWFVWLNICPNFVRRLMVSIFSFPTCLVISDKDSMSNHAQNSHGHFFHLSQISGSRNVGLQARYVFNFFFFLLQIYLLKQCGRHSLNCKEQLLCWSICCYLADTFMMGPSWGLGHLWEWDLEPELQPGPWFVLQGVRLVIPGCSAPK